MLTRRVLTQVRKRRMRVLRLSGTQWSVVPGRKTGVNGADLFSTIPDQKRRRKIS